MSNIKIKGGFTIVELLIVIVVIAILAAISVVAYDGLNYRAKKSATESSMIQLKKAMLSYKAEVGELPPNGDAWNYGTNPPGCGIINSLISALESKGYYGISARDAWSNCWGYDDNDCNANPGNTYIESIGPDAINGGTDDFSILISAGCNS